MATHSTMRLWMVPVFAAGLAAAGWLAWIQISTNPTGAGPLAIPEPPPPPAAAAPPRPPSPATPPNFESIHVAPDGTAVLAGRAQPGAVVSVVLNGTKMADAAADLVGAWSLTLPSKLPPGATQIMLTAQAAGGRAMSSQVPVVVIVAAADQAAAPVVIATPDSAPSRVMSVTGPRPANNLVLDTADYDDQGRMRFGGTAPLGASVRLYIDNQRVGEAAASSLDGHWSLSPQAPVKAGRHRLRLDQFAPDGHVLARVEVALKQDMPGLGQLQPGQVMAQPSEFCWLLARHNFSDVVRYTIIYRPEKEQAAEPARIYPGQVLPVSIHP